MRWFWYALAVAATALSLVLWSVVLRPRAVSVPAVSTVETAVGVGVLPDVRPLVVVDPVRAALSADVEAGRAVCWGGFYARLGAGGVPRLVTVDGSAVPCP